MTSKCFMRIYRLLLNFITLAGLPAAMQLSEGNFSKFLCKNVGNQYTKFVISKHLPKSKSKESGVNVI